MRVEYHRHNLGERELKEIGRIFKGVFLTTGAETALFERRLADYLGYKSALAIGVTSCTMALRLALKACGVGPGDRVITTPLSFVATANAIVSVGAIPHFVDVEPDTGNIDVSKVQEAMWKCRVNPKAILPVHLYGQMVDMLCLAAAARMDQVAIVEDSAHCIEGMRSGVRPGELGDAACFSFQALKPMTSGEGGAVVVRDLKKAELLDRLRNHGLTRGAFKQRQKFVHADMVELGEKAGMSDIQAAVLNPQLDLLDTRLRRREEIAARYEYEFTGFPGIELPCIRHDVQSARSMFTIWVDPEIRDAVIEKIREAGIGATVQYNCIHLHSFYREKFGLRENMYPHAERISSRTIALPFYTQLTEDEIEYVIRTVKMVVTKERS